MPPTPMANPTPAKDSSPRKKVKLTKDAAVFTPGCVRGECRFPPDEYQNEELASYHQQFEVTPFGKIAEYPRHIPYNSEKKTFLKKTCREYLEVFQYTFKVPGDDHIYTMLWDYNIGLVRTTPLFKCTGHSKTTPAKMLNRNLGLKDICHSITGGALIAQGYWIPYAAAKAIAATFCYDIRYALTPVFGHDFPSICIKPGEDGFGDMIIDPQITKYCTEQAKQFRYKDGASSTSSSTPSQWSLIPNTPNPHRLKVTQARRLRKIGPCYTSSYNSSYKSEAGPDDRCNSTITPSPTPTPTPTPESLYRHVFIPVNTPGPVPRSVPYPERYLPSPRDILAQSEHHYHVRTHVPMTPLSTVRCQSPEISPRTIPASMASSTATTNDKNQDGATFENLCDLEWLSTRIHPDEEYAAYALLGLKLGKSPKEAARGLGTTISGPGEQARRWA